MTPWYKTAVFYEVPVYAYADGNGDGIGDFVGMTQHLDYLQWLGVTCIWTLPFYQSPLRDGGYDISDFRAVLASYGTVEDVTTLIEETHRRGMRIIADLVVNHTSDQHPWFQEARRPGSPTRDRYVWTNDPTQWDQARVIFIDTHESNWTWDDTAGAYYWHRFFDHQPDLNYHNPDVAAEMIDVVRYWLDVGFDGLRLDAVPYLYERTGTNGENLPETHAWLKKLRAVVDAEYDDRVLLAEANQWPRDVVEYFGAGNECHMAFHFPLMPRLFLALKRHDATPIKDVLAATPEIPESAQWGMFLRNHDELTLEMVSSEDRAFMYDQYAPDPAMRKNLGIRRRLAPLIDGDRDRFELLHAVLLTLPGSPVLYYGDEIGMGDMYRLEDRDGVRTPMQWTPGRGAGFSDADPADFYLPLVDDPQFAPSRVNVESQRDDPGSLLRWMRKMLAIRSAHPILGTAGFSIIEAGNDAVLVYTRHQDGARIVVMANFSDRKLITEVQLPSGSWRSLAARECRLDSGFVELGGYGYGWYEAN